MLTNSLEARSVGDVTAPGVPQATGHEVLIGVCKGHIHVTA